MALLEPYGGSQGHPRVSAYHQFSIRSNQPSRGTASGGLGPQAPTPPNTYVSCPPLLPTESYKYSAVLWSTGEYPRQENRGCLK